MSHAAAAAGCEASLDALESSIEAFDVALDASISSAQTFNRMVRENIFDMRSTFRGTMDLTSPPCRLGLNNPNQPWHTSQDSKKSDVCLATSSPPDTSPGAHRQPVPINDTYSPTDTKQAPRISPDTPLASGSNTPALRDAILTPHQVSNGIPQNPFGCGVLYTMPATQSQSSARCRS
ncbi:hypothetical protein BV22DRAFT_1136002 [Leucogyrophana mollusca]|uniref:Uncharacterized protein n=1 Tax=Leucogyrophana mollusca TaxID=85980 RepID=A0ACB8AWM0_9AGAM|nr:hypothetical protein BV22DRAFT_1136002 [Leucogyrophana mollusca]